MKRASDLQRKENQIVIRFLPAMLYARPKIKITLHLHWMNNKLNSDFSNNIYNVRQMQSSQ